MSNNILLKTINEVRLFHKYIRAEIKRKERYAYAIIHEVDFFEISKLKCYFLENELNDYAKNELLRTARICYEFLEFEDQYSNLPEAKGYFVEFENENNGSKFSSLGDGKLMYFFSIDNRFIRINDNHLDEFKRLLNYDKRKVTFFNYLTLFNKIREILIVVIDKLDIQKEDEIFNAKPKNKMEIGNKIPKLKYNNIFESNAFEVWQSMFDEFDIKESSRSDVKFMFDVMQKDGLIHKTVKQKDFLDWLPTAHNGLIVGKTSNISKTPRRMNAYNRAKEIYKKADT